MVLVSKKEQLPATIVSLISIVVLLGAMVYMVLVPPPTARGLAAEHRKKMAAANRAIKAARDKEEAMNAQIATKTWTGSAEQIGPAAMGRINALAKTRNVSVSAFRPQRLSESEGLDLQPFLANVEGTFPNVVAFARDLETSNTKLAVNLIQISSSDQASDAVTASISLIAYVRDEDKGSG